MAQTFSSQDPWVPPRLSFNPCQNSSTGFNGTQQCMHEHQERQLWSPPAGIPSPLGRLQEMGAPAVEATTWPTCPVRVKLTAADCCCAAVVSTQVPDRLFTIIPHAPRVVTKASFVLSSSMFKLPPACSVPLSNKFKRKRNTDKKDKASARAPNIKCLSYSSL
jgi:hypothetical protein